ncbi:hypothetical protein GGF41_002812, partial [Coemansia sp. RSA 2531]
MTQHSVPSAEPIEPALHSASETTPLLLAPSLAEAGGTLSTSESAATLSNKYLEHDSVSAGVVSRQETALMLLSSVPLALSSLLQSSFHFINILSLGHLGTNELAAATLANMTIFMLVNAPAVGLASALTTFCATAFTASPDKTL